ncbi:Crp/Fnr family transcriptional regulator [Sphingomicrobium sp. XHP0235]|uniref:Crp/Fnr family transcriptional regulator n=1 Tax=Sphingomicrobium aquimarinum TaxID=3133971 RepID=UPI0031FF3545
MTGFVGFGSTPDIQSFPGTSLDNKSAIFELYLRGRMRHALTTEELTAIADAADRTVHLGPRERLIRKGELVHCSYFIVSGFTVRYKTDRRGYRQNVGMQVPGDWVGFHSFPTKHLDHDACSVGEVELVAFPHEGLEKLIAKHPRLTRIMWFSTLLDAAIHREWLFKLGRLNAAQRIAHLICELATRLEFVGLFDGHVLDTPLTQTDFAEASGITAIHCNRSFRELREAGLLNNRIEDSAIHIEDRNGLEWFCEFDADYLYGEGELQLGVPY